MASSTTSRKGGSRTAPTIVFTGGGSAGHVTPNIALIDKFQQQGGWEIVYIGSNTGIEKELITALNIPFFGITAGKLRRYFSWRNFLDPFKILAGLWQAFFLCRKIKPEVIFSKGSFVSFPVVVAAWLNRIPVIIHESDLTPGLANKLSFPFATKICITFADTRKYLKYPNKIIITGTPIRQELFVGDAEKGLKLCGFSKKKPVILVYGGSLGSRAINKAIRDLLPTLTTEFQVAHICGENNIDHTIKIKGYKQFEYLQQGLADVMACASLVISRAGANSLYELLTLRKPHILIPLPKVASRGDQIVNAKHFAQLNLSQVIFEEVLTPDKLYEKITWVNEHKVQLIEHLETFNKQDSLTIIYDILAKYV